MSKFSVEEEAEAAIGALAAFAVHPKHSYLQGIAGIVVGIVATGAGYYLDGGGIKGAVASVLVGFGIAELALSALEMVGVSI